jgi:hypothetical protein
MMACDPALSDLDDKVMAMATKAPVRQLLCPSPLALLHLEDASAAMDVSVDGTGNNDEVVTAVPPVQPLALSDVGDVALVPARAATTDVDHDAVDDVVLHVTDYCDEVTRQLLTSTRVQLQDAIVAFVLQVTTPTSACFYIKMCETFCLCAHMCPCRFEHFCITDCVFRDDIQQNNHGRTTLHVLYHCALPVRSSIRGSSWCRRC